MQSLFRPFVTIETPIRYFLVMFIAFFGGIHLADDIGYLYTSYKHSDPEKLFLIALFTSIVAFTARYLAQKKAWRAAHPKITSRNL